MSVEDYVKIVAEKLAEVEQLEIKRRDLINELDSLNRKIAETQEALQKIDQQIRAIRYYISENLGKPRDNVEKIK